MLNPGGGAVIPGGGEGLELSIFKFDICGGRLCAIVVISTEWSTDAHWCEFCTEL